MENKKGFKVGDKVVFSGLTDRYVTSPSWIGWVAKDKLEVGEEYIVSGVGEDWIDLDGKVFSYENDFFSFPEIDAIVVVLRRQSDRKAIEKFLRNRGFYYESRKYRKDSRAIVVHLGERRGILNYYYPFNWNAGCGRLTAEAVEFQYSQHGYSNVITVNTKPSVKKAINKISKYI